MNTEHLDWQPVVSSQIKAVAFDPHADEKMGDLYVEFNSGAIWQYADVPQERYGHLLEASSKGNFFGKNIKGRYPEKRIAKDEGEAGTGKSGSAGTTGLSETSGAIGAGGSGDGGAEGNENSTSQAAAAADATGGSGHDGHSCSAPVTDDCGNPHPMTAAAQAKGKKGAATPAVKSKSAGGKKAAA